MTDRIRTVGAHLVVEVHQPLRAMLQVAVSSAAPSTVRESLTVTIDGRPARVDEVALPDGNRVHVVDARPGRLVVSYEGAVHGSSAPPLVSDSDRIIYVRPSRYAESDRLAPIAQAEFGGIRGASDLLAAVSSWAGAHLSYVSGSSAPTEGAVDTLLKREGVCRDYAHLVISLLRALDIPARFAAVYAPGLDPMDFHAVAEAAVGDHWRVVDATLLAPRSSLVRIATGRDAADSSFLSIYGGAADFVESTVTAVVSGDLPRDDITALVSLT